jgi:hypothetical protein
MKNMGGTTYITVYIGNSINKRWKGTFCKV